MMHMFVTIQKRTPIPATHPVRYPLHPIVIILFMLLVHSSVNGENIFEKLRKSVVHYLDNDLSDNPSAPQKNYGNDSTAYKILYIFFDDAFTPGGFAYHYPKESNVRITEEVSRHGEVALQFDLFPGDYSGGSVCLYNGTYDLRSARKKGASLQFWIKGAEGNEYVLAALVDEGKSDDKKTVVRKRIEGYGCRGVTTDWTLVKIPLKIYEERGVYWDARDSTEHEAPFNWGKVAEFRIEVRKDENKTFRVWVDDIFIVK